MITFDEAFDVFLKECQQLIDEYWEQSGYNTGHMLELKPTLVAMEGGKRYIRVAKQERGDNRSVYCFIDTTNGDVLKGSWKAPVKNGVRGNIFQGVAAEYMDWHGPKYLR